MASAEAVSWGYVGSLFGSGVGSLVTGLAAALSLFFVIWLADATFVTMDTSRSYYQRMLSPRENVGDSLIDRVVEQRKFVAGLVIRGLVVVVSLWITAPFLAQLVFRRDVVESIRSRNGTSIASARTALAARFDDQLRPLDSALNATQSEGILEAAGQGLSGRYGRGAAVIAMEQRAADLQRRISAISMDRDSTLFAFDRAPPSVLSTRFGVPLLDDGLRSRSEVISVLMENPDYSGTQIALGVFLSFLFLGLVSSAARSAERGASTMRSGGGAAPPSAAIRLTARPWWAARSPPGSSGRTRIGPSSARTTGMPVTSRIRSS
jgi:hypothetical protein